STDRRATAISLLALTYNRDALSRGSGSIRPLSRREPMPDPELMRIVLVHGFPGWGDASGVPIKYFRGVKAHLQELFFRTVDAPDLGSLDDTDDRTLNLEQAIQSFTNDASPKVHIFAHSAGGIDARLLVSPGRETRHRQAGHPPLARLVKSITTVSTPHRGSVIADKLAHPLSAAPLLLAFGSFAEAVRGFTTQAMAAFNSTVKPSADVEYFSYAGVASFLSAGIGLTPFAVTYPLIHHEQGANDGWVSSWSAGIPDTAAALPEPIIADHAGEIGYGLSPIALATAIAGTAFRHVEFYEGLAERRGAIRRLPHA